MRHFCHCYRYNSLAMMLIDIVVISCLLAITSASRGDRYDHLKESRKHIKITKSDRKSELRPAKRFIYSNPTAWYSPLDSSVEPKAIYDQEEDYPYDEVILPLRNRNSEQERDESNHYPRHHHQSPFFHNDHQPHFHHRPLYLPLPKHRPSSSVSSPSLHHPQHVKDPFPPEINFPIGPTQPKASPPHSYSGGDPDPEPDPDNRDRSTAQGIRVDWGDDLSAAAGHHGGYGGGGGHGFFQYARQPAEGAWEFGYRRGNHDHFTERHEHGHNQHSSTSVKAKVRWGDKHGGYGEHYFDINHKGTGDDYGKWPQKYNKYNQGYQGYAAAGSEPGQYVQQPGLEQVGGQLEGLRGGRRDVVVGKWPPRT